MQLVQAALGVIDPPWNEQNHNCQQQGASWKQLKKHQLWPEGCAARTPTHAPVLQNSICERGAATSNAVLQYQSRYSECLSCPYMPLLWREEA